MAIDKAIVTGYSANATGTRVTVQFWDGTTPEYPIAINIDISSAPTLSDKKTVVLDAIDVYAAGMSYTGFSAATMTDFMFPTS